jgi:SPP1 gp7 family putative phage head morphogenesis protein
MNWYDVLPRRKQSFAKFDRFEKRYERVLNKISNAVNSLVDSLTVNGSITSPDLLGEQLTKYSELLEPWAKNVADGIFIDVNKWNRKTFASRGKRIKEAMKQSAAESVTFAAAQSWQRDQVDLIKSIPLNAAKRAQTLAIEAQLGGDRAESIRKQIQNFGKTTKEGARRIARTEIAKANASLTRARADFVGATHYIWRTMDDARVRPSHFLMDDNIYTFAQPPTLSDGSVGNPGTFPNCRCYAEPIIN